MILSDRKVFVDGLIRWKQSPLAFVRERFKVEPDPWQAEILELFPHHPMIAMQACKGPGKTTVEAWLAWNFLVTRPNPNIAATSVDAANLRDNLWKEMAKWRSVDPMLEELFEWNITRIFRKGDSANWFMSARTWPKQSDANEQAKTLAGLHQDYVMFIIDESGGIPPAVMVSAEAALSSCIEGHIVQAGNPSDLNSALYMASKDRVENGGRWLVREITGDPDDPMRAPRVSPDWARSQIRAYGADNPWVLVNIFGRFPAGSINTLISEDEVRAAQKRFYRRHEIEQFARILGIDIAREGLDASVICRRQGIQMFPLLRYRNLTGLEGASITNRLWDEFGVDACFLDATGGYGFAWLEQLQVLGRQAIPIKFSNKAANEDRFVNKRSEMYWRLVEWIKRGGALPGEGEGARELAEALYKTTYFHKNDRIQLEDKDQIKDRLGYSPDEADAAALSFAEPVSPKARQRTPNFSAAAGGWTPFADLDRMSGTNHQTEYDPFKSF